MKKRHILIAGGIDRKGIVFSMTGMLKKYGFNIEDSSMIMMRRTFSVIMLLSNSAGYSKTGFEKSIAAFRKKFNMAVDIKAVSEKQMKEYKCAGKRYMVSISGADRPGIVNEITGIIYKSGANIIGLETKSSEKTKPHAYYMFLEIDLPSPPDLKAFEKRLKSAAKKIGVHVTVSRVEDRVL